LSGLCSSSGRGVHAKHAQRATGENYGENISSPKLEFAPFRGFRTYERSGRRHDAHRAWRDDNNRSVGLDSLATFCAFSTLLEKHDYKRRQPRAVPAHRNLPGIDRSLLTWPVLVPPKWRPFLAAFSSRSLLPEQRALPIQHLRWHQRQNRAILFLSSWSSLLCC
jgi:hypothetical protein